MFKRVHFSADEPSKEASRMSNQVLPDGSSSRRRVARLIVFRSVGFLLVAVAGLVYASSRSSTNSSPSQEIVEATASASPQSALDHFSFTASSGGEDGWTHYESAIEGVALELPSGLGPFPLQEYPPDLILNASAS